MLIGNQDVIDEGESVLLVQRVSLFAADKAVGNGTFTVTTRPADCLTYAHQGPFPLPTQCDHLPFAVA